MSELKGACVIGQSGGPTSVINSSVLGALEAALDNPSITRVFGMAHGIKGLLNDDLYDIDKEDRDELAAYLKSNGIPCGTYYPRPVHTQTAYAQWNTRSLPVCEKLSKTALSIPMTPYLDNQDLDYVINCMNEFAAKKTSKAA